MKKLVSASFMWAVASVFIGIGLFNFVRNQLSNSNVTVADPFLY